MTLEEAAERILQGTPYRDCMHCDAIGSTPDSRERYQRACRERFLLPPGTPAPRIEDHIRPCSRCNGDGSILEKTYAEACEVLGKSLPVSFREKFKQRVDDAYSITKEPSVRRRML